MNQCEIAKKLGISQSAVSLVLRDPTTTRVSAEKKELIVHYLKSNANANASGCKRTWNIGYLTDPTQNIHSEFFQSSLHGTEEEAARCHYNLILECLRNSNINLLRKNKADGFIVRSGKVLEVLKESSSSLPAVLLNCSTDTLQYDVVMPDNRGGMFKIAAHLAQNGCKNAVFFCSENAYSPYSCNYQERRNAFGDACGVYGIVPKFINIAIPVGNAETENFIRQILPSSQLPDAVVSVNHFYAAVTRKLFPQLTVIAGDNKMERGFENDSFPMLVQDGASMGKIAVELLLKRIIDPERKLVRVTCDMDLKI